MSPRPCRLTVILTLYLKEQKQLRVKKTNQPRQTQTLLLKKDGLRLDLAGRFMTINLNAQSLLGVGDADVSSLIGALVRIVYFISSYLTIM